MISFKKFLEWADFGFSNKPTITHSILHDKPIKRVNIEYVINDLKRTKIGIKEAVAESFFGEVQWGQEPGALKVSFGPYGGLRSVIRKLCVDLQGNPRWICKDVIEVKNLYDLKWDSLIQELYEKLNEIDKQGIDAPNNQWNGLEKLVLRLTDYLKRHSTERPLMYEGIRRMIKNEHYIVHFGCAGMGVQRQDQKRLDQFQIDVTYDKKIGCIKVVGQEVGDTLSKHRWITDPSEYLEYFMPEQDEKEILNSVLAHFNSY
jgi:hypothetical protein